MNFLTNMKSMALRGIVIFVFVYIILWVTVALTLPLL
jgi:hypothetical protein